MNDNINYPVKYAVLEIKEIGGWAVWFENVTLGFIASKCYVIESNILYDVNGNSQVIHKVVFPFNNIEKFKSSLKNGNKSIGNKTVPRYDADGRISPVNIVVDLFDSYELAKVAAMEKNDELRHRLILNMESNIDSSNKQYVYLEKELENELAICYLFERAILEATEDMKISDGLTTNKKSFVKILKPKL